MRVITTYDSKDHTEQDRTYYDLEPIEIELIKRLVATKGFNVDELTEQQIIYRAQLLGILD